jgi:hypothetical protein
MKNKRGQLAIALTTGGLIVIAIIIAILLISIFGFAWFLTTNLLTILGGAIIILAVVYGFTSLMNNPNQMKIAVFTVTILFGIILMALPWFSSTFNFAISGSPITKIAIPHQASFRCDVIGSGSPEYIIGDHWIKYNTVGVTTDSVHDILVTVDYGIWQSFTEDLRLRWLVCDKNGNNCYEQTEKYIFAGTKRLPLSSIDLTKQSVHIYFEKYTLAFWKGWQPATGARLKYSYNKFGLRLYSTTRDPAGEIVCSSSCDLTCPSQTYRSKLISTDKNVLGFYQTAPYLEYWESLDYDLNSQYGGTVYDSKTGKFCLAGYVYSSSQLVMEDGTVYIYPNTATRERKQCCPGAVISTQYEDKICQSDYTWKTITKDTRIQCSSDYQCPNAGQYTCQNKQRSGWSCERGYCEKGSNVNVQCCINADCPSDQTCQNYMCVGGYVNPPIDNPPSIEENQTECERLGGKWIEKETITKSFWNRITFGLLGSETTTTQGRCLIPHVSVLSLILLFLGIGVLIFSIIKKVPLAIVFGGILTLIGAIWTAMAGAGYV